MKDIRTIDYIESKNDNINSHVIIYKDLLTGKTDYYTVRFSDNIYEILYMLRQRNFEILEIYNFGLDLSKQFNEEIVYHDKPYPVLDFSNEDVEEAKDFATEAHKNQFRKTGAPFVNHPIRVSKLIGNYYRRSDYINFLKICALLHDVIEDTNTTLIDLTLKFGPKVASIVLELTNDVILKRKLGKEEYLEKKMEVMSSLALLIKLCDRLDNVNDLRETSEEFTKKTISQTINILNYTIDNRLLNKEHIGIMDDILSILLLSNIDENQRIRIHKMKSKLSKKEKIDTLTLKLAR